MQNHNIVNLIQWLINKEEFSIFLNLMFYCHRVGEANASKENHPHSQSGSYNTLQGLMSNTSGM
jgi:hypothetical protein